MKRIILVLLLLAPFSFSIAQQFFSLKHYPYSSFGAHDASLKFEFKNHDNPVKYKVILGDEINYNNGRFDVTSDSIIYSDTVYDVSFDPISGMFQAFKAYAIDSLTNDTLGFIKSKAMLGNSDPGYQRVGFDYVINSLICLGAFKIDSMTYTSNSGYWNSNVTNELYHSESFGAPIADTILLQGAYSIDSICHGYYRFFSPIGFETSFYIDSLGSSSFPVDIITTDDDNSCNGTATATVQSVPPFLYSWDNGAFNASSTVGNLCHGNHILSVVNGVGDTVTTNFVVQESLSYIISTMVDTSNCGGMAMVSNYSSNGPYQYSWDNSAYGVDSLIAGLCSGLHSLSMINVLGDTVHTTFSIDSVEVLGFAFSPDTSNCSGEAFVFANGSVDQYLWDGSSSNNTPQRWGLCYGYHTVTIIFSNGDTISRLFEIEDLAFLSSLDVVTFPDTLNCTGRAEAVVSSTTGPYQYSWDGGSYQSDSIINGLCVGVHELKVLNSLGRYSDKKFLY